MLPLFAGLLVALPVLGHTIWHLYRKLVPPAPQEDEAGLQSPENASSASSPAAAASPAR